jgi:hypothetical protein
LAKKKIAVEREGKPLVFVSRTQDTQALEEIFPLIMKAKLKYPCSPMQPNESATLALDCFLQAGCKASLAEHDRVYVETDSRIFVGTLVDYILGRTRYNLVTKHGFFLTNPRQSAASA